MRICRLLADFFGAGAWDEKGTGGFSGGARKAASPTE